MNSAMGVVSATEAPCVGSLNIAQALNFCALSLPPTARTA